MIALVIGYGSIGQRHVQLLKKLKIFKNIYVYSRQKLPPKLKKCASLREVKKINPDYIIIASSTDKHFKQLQFINNSLNNKKILVEKPLYEKLYKIDKIKNKIYIGYNLRFHPLIQKLRLLTKKKKIFSINSICFSNLKKWRKRKYYLTSSAKKNSGGVIFDLSHEFDFISWIFGNNLKVINYIKRKNSLLKIQTEDYLSLNAVINNKIHVNFNFNYYSEITNRKILVDGKDFSIECDLIKNFLIYKTTKKTKTFLYKKFQRNNTYLDMHKKIIFNNAKDVCSYNSGFKQIKFIKKII